MIVNVVTEEAAEYAEAVVSVVEMGAAEVVDLVAVRIERVVVLATIASKIDSPENGFVSQDGT